MAVATTQHVVSDALLARCAEALHQAHREPPDWTLLAVMMPLVDGYAVWRLLTDHPETRLVPLVIMTARARRQDWFTGLDAGADDGLTTPVHRDALLARRRSEVRLQQAIDA